MALCRPVLPGREVRWCGAGVGRVLAGTEVAGTNVSRGQLFSFPSSLDHL
jgi:hypothetical protein